MTTPFWAEPLLRLALSLAELRDRVRDALAGEFGRAAGDAVRAAVGQALAGGLPPSNPHPPEPDPDNLWPGDDTDPWGEPPAAGLPLPTPSNRPQPPGGLVAAAVAGLTAGRWWLRRRGSPATAVVVGAVVLLATLAGGPTATAGVAALSAAADIAAVADALGNAAGRLSPR